MKKFLVLIIMVLLLFSFADAQKINQGWATVTPDTLAGADTTYYTSPKITKYGAVVGFVYNVTAIADSCNNIIMQGSMDNSHYLDITSVVRTTQDTTMLDINPEYLYYRLFTSTAAGDSSQFDDVKFIYKEE